MIIIHLKGMKNRKKNVAQTIHFHISYRNLSIHIHANFVNLFLLWRKKTEIILSSVTLWRVNIIEFSALKIIAIVLEKRRGENLLISEVLVLILFYCSVIKVGVHFILFFRKKAGIIETFKMFTIMTFVLL